MDDVSLYTENEVTIAREGGISAMLISMRRYPDDQKVHAEALASLGNLSCNGGMFVCTYCI